MGFTLLKSYFFKSLLSSSILQSFFPNDMISVGRVPSVLVSMIDFSDVLMTSLLDDIVLETVKRLCADLEKICIQ